MNRGLLVVLAATLILSLPMVNAELSDYPHDDDGWGDEDNEDDDWDEDDDW